MKFSHQLDYHTIPEWSQYYIDYREMKKLINIYLEELLDFNSDQTPLVSKSDHYKSVLEEFSFQLKKINDFYTDKKKQLKQDLETTITCISKIKTFSTIAERDIKNILSLEEKDDIEDRGTSLQRTFSDLHRQVWWLEVYCEINYIACVKLCEKFNRSGDFKTSLNNSDFINWENELVPLRNSMYEYVASEQGNSDLTDAVKLLTSGGKHYRSTDVAKMSYCFGIILACALVTCYLLTVNYQKRTSEIYPSFPMFRLTLLINFVIICFSWVIYMLEAHSLNWIYILELSHLNRTSYFQVLRIGLFLSAIWSVFFMFSTYSNFYIGSEGSKYFAISLLFIYCCVLLCPFNILLRGARWTLITTFFGAATAPFGAASFKNYLMASWMTSLAVPIKDVYLSICFISSSAWTSDEYPRCYLHDVWLCFLPMLPFTWRLFQIFNRIYLKPSIFKSQIWNFFRYGTSIILVTMTYFKLNRGDHAFIWICMYIVVTEYTSFLDVYQDWGLLKNSKNGWLLRENIYFKPSFYYKVIIVNFICRFAWTLSLLPIQVLETPVLNQYLGADFLMLVMAVSEIIRRTLWTVIRVERERSENTEKFREIDYVPKPLQTGAFTN